MPKRKASSPIDMNGDEGSDDGAESGGDVAAKRSYPVEMSAKLDVKAPGELSNFSDDIGSHFKSLNQSFVSSIRKAVEKDPSVCLVPIAQDYVTHSKSLMIKYQISSSPVLSLEHSEEFSKMEDFFRERGNSGNLALVTSSTQQQQTNTSEPLKNGIISKFPVPSSPSTMSFGSSANFAKGNIEGIKSNPTMSNSSTGKPSEGSTAAKPAPQKTVQQPFKDFKFGPTTSTATSTPGGFSFGMLGSASSTPSAISKEASAPVTRGDGTKSSFFGNMSPIASNSTPARVSGGFDFKPKTDGFESTMTSVSTTSGSSGGGFFQFPFKPSVPQASQLNTGSTSASADTKEAEGEENEEPPKNEFKPVVEDDALYSVRCKVFGMLKGSFKDKGVGQLFVKKLEDSEKYQVVVRADNNLGTILLNVLLKEELPLKKKSAKDVLTVDPTGDDGKPLTILIRVKNEEAADELLEKLKHYAQQSNNNS